MTRLHDMPTAVCNADRWRDAKGQAHATIRELRAPATAAAPLRRLQNLTSGPLEEGIYVDKNTLDTLIRTVKLDGEPLDPVNYDEQALTWFTTLAILDPPRPEQLFEIQFRPVEDPIFETPPHLVVSWVVMPTNEVRSDALRSLELYTLVNARNASAGAKFRIQDFGGDAASLVCDVDLVMDEQLTPELLASALARGRDLVAQNFDDLKALARA